MIHSLQHLKKVACLKISSLATHFADLYEEIEDIKKGLNNERRKTQKRIQGLEELVAELQELVEKLETKKEG